MDGLTRLEVRVAKTLAGTEDPKSQEAEQLLALLQLVRWLQLYLIGDPVSIDPGLASELTNIFKAAFGKKGEVGHWL